MEGGGVGDFEGVGCGGCVRGDVGFGFVLIYFLAGDVMGESRTSCEMTKPSKGIYNR